MLTTEKNKCEVAVWIPAVGPTLRVSQQVRTLIAVIAMPEYHDPDTLNGAIHLANRAFFLLD